MRVDTLSFLAKYAINLKAANFPVLTARRREHRTTDLEVLMLGDSHGWGQGAPGYDVILPAYYSSHMAVPYSKGFFSGLREHINSKYDFYPTAILPGRGDQAGNLKPVSGIHKEINVEVASLVSASGFYAPCKDDRQAAAHLGYLAFNNKFSEKLLILAPDHSGSASCQVDMLAHASKVYIGVLTGRSGAKLEVSYQKKDIDGGLIMDNGAVRRGNTAGVLYPQVEGYPKITRMVNGEHRVPTRNEVMVTESGVVIDTFNPDGDEEIVYCIDYGQKQLGKLWFDYAGANPDAVAFEHPESPCEGPVLKLRGMIFDGNDVRNFSMGGHTVGQWLGDGTPSNNDPSYPHVDELLSYVPFTPTLTIIQAPIVNEYLRQTPIDTFIANLASLLDKLNQHHNPDGLKRMDVLLFTTPGDKIITYEGGASASIGYGEYYGAVKAFAMKSGYGFVDFEHYFRDCVTAGLLDYEFLFDDPIHPSPYVNEFIRALLSDIIDILM